MPQPPIYPWRVGDEAWDIVYHTRVTIERVLDGGATVASSITPRIECNASSFLPLVLPYGTRVHHKDDAHREALWAASELPPGHSSTWVWNPEWGGTTVEVLAYPARCRACGMFGHIDFADACRQAKERFCKPPAPTKGPGEGAGLCEVCGLDRLLISRRGRPDSIDVHGGPCEPVRACGHRDEIEARWFERGVWRTACRECAVQFEPEEV